MFSRACSSQKSKILPQNLIVFLFRALQHEGCPTEGERLRPRACISLPVPPSTFWVKTPFWGIMALLFSASRAAQSHLWRFYLRLAQQGGLKRSKKPRKSIQHLAAPRTDPLRRPGRVISSWGPAQKPAIKSPNLGPEGGPCTAPSCRQPHAASEKLPRFVLLLPRVPGEPQPGMEKK